MIKYANVLGYENLGEVQMFSHLYQMIEKDKETPMVILIHAYGNDDKIFKGYVFTKTKTTESVPLTEEERKAIEFCTGSLKQVPFKDFVTGTILEDGYADFKEAV